MITLHPIHSGPGHRNDLLAVTGGIQTKAFFGGVASPIGSVTIAVALVMDCCTSEIVASGALGVALSLGIAERSACQAVKVVE